MIYQKIDTSRCAGSVARSVSRTMCTSPYPFGQWPEFIAQKVRSFLSHLDVKPLFIEPGSPWEIGYIESFNGKMRDELLSRESFYSLKEAQVLVEMWRKHYTTVRPHSSLGYRPPAPETIVGQPSQIQQFSKTL